MKKIILVVICILLLISTGCKLDVTDFSTPDKTMKILEYALATSNELLVKQTLTKSGLDDFETIFKADLDDHYGLDNSDLKYATDYIRLITIREKSFTKYKIVKDIDKVFRKENIHDDDSDYYFYLRNVGGQWKITAIIKVKISSIDFACDSFPKWEQCEACNEIIRLHNSNAETYNEAVYNLDLEKCINIPFVNIKFNKFSCIIDIKRLKEDKDIDVCSFAINMEEKELCYDTINTDLTKVPICHKLTV